MKYFIDSCITVWAAARLIITNDLDLSLSSNWSDIQSKNVLDELLGINYVELIDIVDRTRRITLEEIHSDNIPQFGEIKNIVKVPKVVIEEASYDIDYVKLGFLLKQDPYASVQANQKYGENHGKIASQLGLIDCIDKKFRPSIITKAFVDKYSEEEQYQIISKLFLRVPIVKMLLQQSLNKIVNGYECMPGLASSTQKRRGTNVRAIFEVLKTENQDVLEQRLQNIIWEIK